MTVVVPVRAAVMVGLLILLQERSGSVSYESVGLSRELQWRPVLWAGCAR